MEHAINNLFVYSFLDALSISTDVDDSKNWNQLVRSMRVRVEFETAQLKKQLRTISTFSAKATCLPAHKGLHDTANSRETLNHKTNMYRIKMATIGILS